MIGKHWALAWGYVAAAAVVTMLLLTPPALAGGPGRWTNLTGSTGSTQTQAGAVRMPSGALQLVWTRDTPGADSYDVCTRSVATDGTFGSIETVLASWPMFGDPAIVLEADGTPRVFVAGRDAFDASCTHAGMCTVVRSETDGQWVLDPHVIDDQADGDTTGSASAIAIARAGASPLVGWWKSTVYVRAGLDPAQPQYDYHGQLAKIGGYYPSFAVDGQSGNAYLAWTSIAAGHKGLYVQQVGTDGAPVGTPERLPSCAAIYDGALHFFLMSEPAPLTGRPGRDGLFAAYPVGGLNADTVRFWRVGSTPVDIASGSQVKDRVAISADTAGRVWVVWSSHAPSGGSEVTLYARRSNKAVTAWGAPVKVRPPGKGLAIFSMAARAQEGRLDLLAHFAPYAQGTDGATWHTQLRPGMTVKATPSRLPLHRKVKIRVTVRDAGVPVKGALVRLCGRSARTGADGVARLTVGPLSKKATLSASVTRGGYAKAILAIKAR